MRSTPTRIMELFERYARLRHGLIPGKEINETTTMRSENPPRCSLPGRRHLEYSDPQVYPL
jgi:hypothetical protein